MLASQSHQVAMRDAERVGHGTQMVLDQVGTETVVSGWDRRVGSEDNLARDPGHSLLETQPFFLHAAANGFQHRETAVSFVEVQHARRDPHRTKCAVPADAEHQFLTDTDPAIAAIEPRSQFPVFRCIAFHVGVQQQQIATANLHPPDFSAKYAATGLDGDGDGVSVRPDGLLHRHLAHVGGEVLFLLPALLVQPLAKISLTVEQPNSYQRNAKIGGAFNVVASQHAQSTRVFRDRDVQAELRREISHRTGAQHAGIASSPGAVRFQIFPLTTIGIIDAAVQHQFAGAPLNGRQRHLRQHGHRIVTQLPPAYRIQIPKQPAGVMVPAPPHVAGQRP